MLIFLPFVCINTVCVVLVLVCVVVEVLSSALTIVEILGNFCWLQFGFRLRSFIKYFSEFFLFKLFDGSKFEQKYVLLNFITLVVVVMHNGSKARCRASFLIVVIYILCLDQRLIRSLITGNFKHI